MIKNLEKHPIVNNHKITNHSATTSDHFLLHSDDPLSSFTHRLLSGVSRQKSSTSQTRFVFQTPKMEEACIAVTSWVKNRRMFIKIKLSTIK